MTIGFRGRSDALITQIDSAYTNFHLIAKGTASFQPRSGYYDFYATVTLNSPNSIVVVRSANAFRLYGVEPVGNTYYQRYYSNNPGTMEWFMFDLSFPNQGTMGMRIRKENGELCYNSNNRIMKVVGQFAKGRYDFTGKVWTFPQSSTRLGIAFNGFGYYASFHGSPDYGEPLTLTMENQLITANSNSLYLSVIQQSYIVVTGGYDVDTSPVSGIVVDVENLIA